MKLEKHVLLAIDSFMRGEKEEALLHASFAIDGTARNFFSKDMIGKQDYKSCLRQYWWIIERFIGEGLNLEETKFTNLKLDDGHGELISAPDLVDIVYHIFRCNLAHAREIPINFELLSVEDGSSRWEIDRVNNGVKMPERVIWALLAVSVFSKANAEIATQSDHLLTWGSKDIGYTEFKIKDWWGKEDKLKEFFSDKPQSRIKLDKL